MTAAPDLQTQGGQSGGAAVPAPVSPEEFMGTPLGFAALMLGLPMYQWQSDVLSWFRNPKVRTMGALCTPNGAGKSSGVVAALALWWIARFPKGRCVITTKDSKQLDEQLYPALEKHRGKFKDWRWVTSPYIQIETTSGGKIVAFTTNDPGRAEGWHKTDDTTGPLLMIVDEAKSVEPQIFEAIDRCTFNALLYVSSPGEMMGQFYDAFSKNRAIFKTRKVSLLECPHIPPEKIDIMGKKYGVDSQLYRSSILGEFMLEGDIPYVFKLNEVARALENPPRAQPGMRTLFCDFAAGGDENAIAMREGNVLALEDAWREKDTMQACTRFVMNFRRLGVTAENIFGDNGGVGKVMMDALAKLGWDINRVDNQSPPWDRNYMHRGAEMWHETSGAVRRSEIHFKLSKEEEEEVTKQLCCRRSRWTDTGKLGVERKEDMEKRGVPSPDRADALCGAWACAGLVPSQERSVFDEWEEMRDEMDTHLALPAGGFAGG